MNSFKRKLILGVLSLAMTAVCLTTTTYAWFARNSEAWTNELEFEIESYDGLLISVDGKNFKASLDNDDLKRAIVAKSTGKSPSELTSKEIADGFNEITFKDVTTNDLKDFYTVDENNKVNGTYKLIKLDKPTNYYSFDLYFKIDSHGFHDEVYDLAFVSPKYEGSSNSESKDKDEAKVSLVPEIKSEKTVANVHSAFSVLNKSFKAGDKIDVDLKNASRIGVMHDGNKSFTIYEPYMGYGSYAIEGDGDKLYDPANNYMLKHLEAYGGKLPTIPGDKKVYKNTVKSFDDEISFGRFTPDEESNYNDLKINVCIWLEGYDSDYLSTVANTKMSFKLGFFKKEVLANEKA